jgi:hypothetical protein
MPVPANASRVPNKRCDFFMVGGLEANGEEWRLMNEE